MRACEARLKKTFRIVFSLLEAVTVFISKLCRFARAKIVSSWCVVFEGRGRSGDRGGAPLLLYTSTFGAIWALLR
jgi:hypothetical protein